jgi:O-6-methylguanine DNA methyltransferase
LIPEKSEILCAQLLGPGGGEYRLAVGPKGILALGLPGTSAKKFEEEVTQLLTLPSSVRGLDPRLRGGPSDLLDQAVSLVEDWDFDVASHVFSLPLPLDLRGTAFRLRVWKALQTVLPGCVVTYGELADRAGAPRAARAVGTAMRNNPIPLFVPCHRVVASTGPGRFGSAGVGLKLELLRREGYCEKAGPPFARSHE